MSDDSTSSGGATSRWPTAIYFIRHGEKPGQDDGTELAASSGALVGPPYGVDLDGNRSNDSLVPRGWQRAGGLATLFDPAGAERSDPLLKTPAIIAVPKYGDPSQHRPYQTVLPLASKLSLSPTVTVKVGCEADLVAWVLEQAGRTVLVCWEHHGIGAAMAALADHISGGDVPGPWPANRFDLVIALTADASGSGVYHCTQVPQLLLAGDSTDPIPAAPSSG